MYQIVNIKLSPSQVQKLKKAIKDGELAKIVIYKENISKNGTRFFVNATQKRMLDRVMDGSKNGYRLSLNKTQLKKSLLLGTSVSTIQKGNIEPLTNHDIDRYLNNEPWYRGVFMHDKLPKSLENNTGIVINLDESDGQGTHWVCLNRKNDVFYYYDSFGFPPSERIKKLAKGYRAYYSSSQQQKATTVTCGWFCVTFLKKLFGSNAYDAVYQFDQKPSDANEEQVINDLKK